MAAERIRPMKLTGRTKEQIVCEKELELYSHVIHLGPCDGGCRCGACFQRALDRLIETQREALNDDKEPGVDDSAAGAVECDDSFVDWR